MANFWYYDQHGHKQGTFSTEQIVRLAQQGVITPETIIENAESGKTRQARKIEGLMFAETASHNTPLPQNTEQAEIDLFFEKFGRDIHKADEYGWTLLHKAAELGKVEVVEFLISQGADISAEANSGRTPLDVAKDHGNTAVVEYFHTPTISQRIAAKKRRKEVADMARWFGVLLIVGIIGFGISQIVDLQAFITIGLALLITVAHLMRFGGSQSSVQNFIEIQTGCMVFIIAFFVICFIAALLGFPPPGW